MPSPWCMPCNAVAHAPARNARLTHLLACVEGLDATDLSDIIAEALSPTQRMP